MKVIQYIQNGEQTPQSLLYSSLQLLASQIRNMKDQTKYSFISNPELQVLKTIAEVLKQNAGSDNNGCKKIMILGFGVVETLFVRNSGKSAISGVDIRDFMQELG